MKAEPRGKKHERPSHVQEKAPTPEIVLQARKQLPGEHAKAAVSCADCRLKGWGHRRRTGQNIILNNSNTCRVNGTTEL